VRRRTVRERRRRELPFVTATRRLTAKQLKKLRYDVNTLAEQHSGVSDEQELDGASVEKLVALLVAGGVM